MAKCADCGFLATHPSERYEEGDVLGRFRSRRTLNRNALVEASRAIRGDPRTPMVCLLGVRRFGWDESFFGEDMSDRLFELNRDYPCGQFFSWRQGFSPQEHVLQRRDEQRHADAAATEGRLSRLQWIIIAVGVGQVLATIAAAFIARSQGAG
jgi:hypothetical protein